MDDAEIRQALRRGKLTGPLLAELARKGLVRVYPRVQTIAIAMPTASQGCGELYSRYDDLGAMKLRQGITKRPSCIRCVVRSLRAARNLFGTKQAFTFGRVPGHKLFVSQSGKYSWGSKTEVGPGLR